MHLYVQYVWRVSTGHVEIGYLMAMSTAMNMEHTGSARYHSYKCISDEEMITPTLPSVSASTCRNTPGKKQNIVGMKMLTFHTNKWLDEVLLHTYSQNLDLFCVRV